MTVRTDITVNQILDPRLAEISSTSDEITVQDSHDTLRNIEDDPSSRLYDKLVVTTGKQDLGGGDQVGLTTALQNVQYAPQRTSSIESGTVTTADTDGEVLIDSLATFVTNGVARGDWVLNFTDQSVTEVLTVDSEIQLTCRALSDGTDNQFGLGDAYKVWNVTVFDMTGGNFTAVDEVGSTIKPYFSSFGRTVAITASSSATIANQEQLQAATFIGKEGLGVSIDPISGTDSSVFPYGNVENPCKTEANVLAVEASRGFRNIFVKSSMTIAGDHSGDPNVWFGDNPQTVTITLDNACDVTNSKFQDCTINGKLDSNNIIWESIVGSITNANGFIYKCTIVGPIVVSGTTSMEDCWTATPGTNNVIDFNSTANTCALTDWSGGTIEVKKMVAGCIFGIGGTAGSVYFDPATCTGGSMNIGGAIRLKSQTVAEVEALGITVNDASTATQVLTAAQTTPIHSDVKKVTSIEITGVGTEADPWGP